MVEEKEVLTCKKWGVTTIRHILENQTYVGDTINNKSTQKLFAGQTGTTFPKNSGMWQRTHIRLSLQGMILKRCKKS